MNCILDVWRSEPQKSVSAVIIPDGCRDLIIKESKEVQKIFISSLYNSPCPVEIYSDEKIMGYRFAPGSIIQEEALLASMRENGSIEEKISNFVYQCPNVDEALKCIKDSLSSVAKISRSLGVSERTLQRHLSKLTGKSPKFWLQLARVRSSALAIAQGRLVIETAFDYGYADQAHLSREVRRWFGVSPTKLKRRIDLTSQLLEPSY